MYSSVWYDNLIKPVLQPPAWVFFPIWIILYASLFISIILYSLTITAKNKTNGYIYFIVHMFFNILWSPVFFNLHKIKIAFAVILVIDVTVIFLISKFYSVSKIAGIIIVPYFLWLMFATYLNFMFLILN